ncbi:DUF4334 domain-containing protein [Luteipulveratus sp. YIM 133132]|uniref:DUF4334 domain-containing protein n=1 Tax=Luteipulveratus flavus TaxID=3031728 RepID=UPI0023B13E72|nr:DUF4334 domain-containing protein [Luteipulveratus sp. YIM 133132]MDE9364750.1 DUF4334 domain-containing protein [Luteipulveratus sp. YIM 133132]
MGQRHDGQPAVSRDPVPVTLTDRLAALGERATVDEAAALFDDLPPLRAEELTGRWHGREIATGHPLDGLLGPSGWYGKQFDGVDEVHPLLFRSADGSLYAADPRRMPLGLAGRLPAFAVDRASPAVRRLSPLLRTRRHSARLRNIEHRGVVTAAMVYDDLPIIDVFRAVDADTMLGLMDYRVHPAPFFFVLERDSTTTTR